MCYFIEIQTGFGIWREKNQPVTYLLHFISFIHGTADNFQCYMFADL